MEFSNIVADDSDDELIQPKQQKKEKNEPKVKVIDPKPPKKQMYKP